MLSSVSLTLVLLGHTKLFSCFWSYKSLKDDQTTRLFFFFFGNQVERKWCTNSTMHRRGWGLGTRIQNTDTCVSKEPKYRGLDGEAIEYRLCKHCGCVLNTDYIWLRKSSSSEKIDPHADQKQEINFVWPYTISISIMEYFMEVFTEGYITSNHICYHHLRTHCTIWLV